MSYFFNFIFHDIWQGMNPFQLFFAKFAVFGLLGVLIVCIIAAIYQDRAKIAYNVTIRAEEAASRVRYLSDTYDEKYYNCPREWADLNLYKQSMLEHEKH